MLGLGFILNFHDTCVNMFYGTVYYRFGFASKSFIILDTNNAIYNYNSCFSLAISTSNMDMGESIWYAKLENIGQECICHLTIKSLLGTLAKLKFFFF